MRMPYDQRILQNTTTSNLCHRQRSRRRIAAVSFLSNISLDGTHQDTNLSQFTSLPHYLQKLNKKEGLAPNIKSLSCHKNEGMQSLSCKDSSLSVVVGSENSLASDSLDQIKRSTSRFKNVPLETVGDANIYLAQPVTVHKVTSTMQDIKPTQSNRSSINSDFNSESQSTDKNVVKTHNPNLNSNLGCLDAIPTLIRSNSTSKRSHVSSTREKCASAGKQVATKVRSLTARSNNTTRNSMSNSNTSVSAIPEDQLITRQCPTVGKQQTCNLNDKENIGPEHSNYQKTQLQDNQGLPQAPLLIEGENAIKERAPVRRRKLGSNPITASGGSDKGFSSCESIGAQLVSTGLPRTRKPSSSISESSSSNAPTNFKDIKYLRLGHLPFSTTTGTDYRSCTVAEYRSVGVGAPPSLSEPRGGEGRASSSVGGQGSTVCVASVTACVARHATEGRVLLTTGKGPPLHIFSLIKYKFHGALGAEGGGGGVGAVVVPRKRNVSGSRHLATITDAADTAPLLPSATAQSSPPVVLTTGGGGAGPGGGGAGGLANKLQEVSYCNLLVSSQYFGGGKRRHLSDQTTTDERTAAGTLQQQQQQQHALLARCFSHDPAAAAAVAGGNATSIVDPSHALPPPVTSYSQSAIASLAAIDIVPSAGGGASHGSAKPTPHWAGFSRAAFNYNYAPELLDDPELRAGKHRKLLCFPSYMISLIDYAKPDELKREVNDKFRTKFPHVKITLSKLRSLKREMVHIVQQSFSRGVAESCALLTVAHAHAYFDSLCLSGAVEKTSRKPLAGACIMISAKINDVKGEVLATLIDRIESQLRVDRCDLLSSEFVALLSLQFNIHLPTPHINTHYQRLLFEH